MSAETLGDLVLALRASAGGSRVLLRDGDRTLTAADFVADLHALALAFLERGLEPGQRVVLAAENRPEWPVVDLAVSLIGAVLVPVDPGLSEDALAVVLRNAAPRWVVHDLGERVARITPSLADAPGVLDLETEIVEWLGRGAVARPDRPLERFRGTVEPEALASVHYTAGTEGKPRGVRHSHRSLIAHAEALGAALRPREDDVVGIGLPLAHPAGRSALHMALGRGLEVRLDGAPEATLGILAAPVVEEVAAELSSGNSPAQRWALDVGRRWAEARRRGIVGPFLATERWLADRLVLREETGQRGLRQLRRLLVIGRARADALDQIEAAGLVASPTWGLTEAWPVATVEEPPRLAGAAGRPLAGVEIRIDDDGRVEVRGEGVMMGYWRPDEGAESVGAQGWLRTGDLGRVSEGHLIVEGRVRDRLRVEEREIAVETLEAALEVDPRIECAWVPGGRRDRTVALLRFAVGTDVESQGGLVEAATARWPSGWHLDAWGELPPGEVPRTRTGALQRRVCEERWRDVVAGLG